MATSTRRKMSEDAQQLELCAEALRELGASIGGCAFRRTTAHALAPVRAAEAASSSSSRAPKRRALSASPPASLYSLLSRTAYAAKTSASSRPDSWLEALERLVPELADAAEARDRAARLRRRYESLAASVRVLQVRVQQQTDEVALQDRVEAQLATEETAWEQQMQTREQRVAEREVELKALREENASDALSQHAQDDADEDDADEDDAEDDAEDARAEAEELQEALALRLEERRDIEAAVESLQAKKRRRESARAASLEAAGGPGEGDAASAARELVLRELRGEKQALQREILAAEETQERQDAHHADLPALKQAVAAARRARAEAQTQADALRLELARRKRKMTHMVDVQLLTARDSSPPVLREEAALLHLLAAHEGQMGVSELKHAARELLAEHARPHGNGVVIRALYALVANGVVQIDRSCGDGLVTSLLV